MCNNNEWFGCHWMCLSVVLQIRRRLSLIMWQTQRSPRVLLTHIMSASYQQERWDSDMPTWDRFSYKGKSLTFDLRNQTTDTPRIKHRPTCSDVKATSLGTDDIPFSLTSGNILKRASSMAYMLEIAPPRGQDRAQWLTVRWRLMGGMQGQRWNKA